MLDETVYRCIGASCARSLPRRVNFCPYCGTAQHAGAADAAQRAGREAVPPAVVLNKPAAAVPPPVPPAAAGAAGPVATQWGAAPRAATGESIASAGSARPAPPAPPASAATSAPTPTRIPTAAPTPAPARPPERAPVRVRWWAVALLALWLIWIKEKPATNRVDARIDHAIALATECKAREAQSELIALRSTDATQEQLLRVQQALNEAAAACSRSRRRDAPWRGAGVDVESPVRRPLESRSRWGVSLSALASPSAGAARRQSL